MVDKEVTGDDDDVSYDDLSMFSFSLFPTFNRPYHLSDIFTLGSRHDFGKPSAQGKGGKIEATLLYHGKDVQPRH